MRRPKTPFDRTGPVVAGALLGITACAPALRQPPPVPEMGSHVLAPGSTPASAVDTDRLVAEGDAHFAQRPRLVEVRAAQRAFLEASRADATGVAGLLGLARVTIWLVEHEPDGEERKAQVELALQAAQWCGRRAPRRPDCDYLLAQALGQQARERPSTAHDGLNRMVEALQRAIAGDPGLDDGGPHRVLALVYLRAPGWPAGPGDAEEGLRQAEKASALDPDYPPNQLARAEALAKNGRTAESHAAYEHAFALSLARVQADDPDAAEWAAEAERALGRAPPSAMGVSSSGGDSWAP
jgi:tetratricopeptide (TPR) repeat protein